jgi:CheY-like chemotaxis protein
MPMAEAANSDDLVGGHVLIVEDDVLVAYDIAAVIEGAGGEIVGPAHAVREALAMLAAQSIDVAILDVNLHGEAVYPVADALSAKAVPFVFVTGHSNEAIPDRFRRNPWLQKPYTSHSLLSAVATAMPSTPHREAANFSPTP